MSWIMDNVDTDWHKIMEVPEERKCLFFVNGSPCSNPTNLVLCDGGESGWASPHNQRPLCEKHMVIECKRLGLWVEPKRKHAKNMTCEDFARTARRLRLKGAQGDWLKLYRIVFKGSSLEEEMNYLDLEAVETKTEEP